MRKPAWADAVVYGTPGIDTADTPHALHLVVADRDLSDEAIIVGGRTLEAAVFR
jgi:hypothetical protein